MRKAATVTLVAGLGCFAPRRRGGRVSARRPPLEDQGAEARGDRARAQPGVHGSGAPLPGRLEEVLRRADAAAFRKALKLGRDTYIAEACWHCHSQFVRPVSNEDIRFGKVSYSAEYMNEMFLPHLFGTRRVGPDLIRESGTARQRLARGPLLRPDHRRARPR